ncbi:MAG: ATPase [Proteobacteria bacterium]|nr:ATPase [Pseudomonadota bacterium]
MARGFREPGDKPRRFYSSVSVAAMNGGFTVTLDGRTLRGPKGAPTVLPTEPLAALVAEEWAGQGETLELAAMAATRLANTAIESIPQAREPTAQQVADYAGTELLCYRAEGPTGLVARQAAQWDPILSRAETELGLTFIPATGIVHQPQPPQTLERVKTLALQLDDFALTGLAFGVPLLGSAVLSFGLMRGWFHPDEAFDLSRLDEAWQEEKWGVDEEAAERTALLRGEAGLLGRWFAALG